MRDSKKIIYYLSSSFLQGFSRRDNPRCTSGLNERHGSARSSRYIDWCIAPIRN